MILESVLNFSEGRRPEVIARLAAASEGAGASLLDVHSDPDHNRSVLTVVGTPPQLQGGLLAVFELALGAIDLRQHEGVHPRVGAVDVVPFVPLAGAPMSAAIAAAELLAAAVAARFELPVYLYENAARDPGRRDLPLIRRGGFEGFAAKMALPGWEPDIGPRRIHPSAGVTVIGARFFLIALNLVLASADLQLARRIARGVRASNGGLPAVRAIGVRLVSRRRVQVSLNLLDYRVTSMSTAFAAVARAAGDAGVEIEQSELVGLVPEAALPRDPAGELQLRLLPRQVLEHQLQAVGLA